MRKFIRILCDTKVVNKRTFKYVFADYIASGKDIMKKGGKFYAVLDRETNFWSKNENDISRIVDREIDKYIKSHFIEINGDYYDSEGNTVKAQYLDSSVTRGLKEFTTWFSLLPPDHNYIQLDEELTFKDDKVTPEMYRSKKLDYNIREQSIDAYDKLISILYPEEERQKLEWAIGSVLTGDSKEIEKMIVLYGAPGSGKSTILKLIKKLTSGYWAEFSAEQLASKSYQFSTSQFKDNPLVAIDGDGSLAKIDCPVMNKIISHEDFLVNEKGKQQYTIKSNTMLFMSSNDPVDIHDTKLGITRRLIDVYPSGIKLPVEEYEDLVKRTDFEIPGIAYHCIQVYKSLGKNYYLNYRPNKMIAKTNYIRNFLFDNLEKYQDRKFCLRDDLYSDFKIYCEDSGLGHPPKKFEFGEQLLEYFDSFNEVKWTGSKSSRNVFTGLRVWKILGISEKEYLKDYGDNDSKQNNGWIQFNSTVSLFDKLYSNQPAQYATEEGTPVKKWSNVRTKLRDIDTSKLHWLKLPENVIKIDFDKKDANGNKSLELNLVEANKFPRTYAEVSKSGCGIHLYYIYDGDPSMLSRIYEENIEVKVSTGNNSHRRILTKCNDLPIATISTGLPLKGGQPMVDENIAINEKGLRTTIRRCIAKEIHGDTRSNIDWICEILNRAYEAGITYDVSDMRQDILNFAMNSTHQKKYCVDKLEEMKFCSESAGSYESDGYRESDPIIFFDFEVKPNMNLLCWKEDGEGKKVFKIFNPSPEYIADFFGFNKDVKNKVIGYNNKEYDNHIAYGIYMGKTPEEIFNLSQAIISKQKNAKYREAKHMSYSDVLDFLPTKMSLKKWEIKLGVPHQEFNHPWDEPIPEELWPMLAEYCENDVLATEAVFHSKEGQAAWKGRKILCDLANILMGPGSTVNDSTNDLTTKLIVGNEREPQKYFNYPDLSLEFPGYEFCASGIDKERYISKDVIISGKSFYRGYDPGEGGFVYGNPGMYGHSVCFDVASEHPSSIIAENGFGKFTENFKRLLDLRLMIKHKQYDEVRKLYNGALAKYLESDADAKALSFALKIAINSVYGLTAAGFPNRLRDGRNKDNWVAKRGALFMIDLMLNVREMGYTVIHCKTDSIKVLNPDEKVSNYIFEFGKKFGYNFEIEHIFDRICLVNDAVYACKYTNDPENGDMAGKWDATGKQYGPDKTPYVFKALFSHEPIEFKDVCETRSASTALYLDYNEGLLEGEHNYVFIGKTGLFTPVLDGCGGGELYRDAGDGKYSRVEGTTRPKEKGKKQEGYRWMEAAAVQELELYDKIDYSYYQRLVDKGADNIMKWGDLELFLSDEPIPLPEVYPLPDFMNIPETDNDEVPFI